MDKPWLDEPLPVRAYLRAAAHSEGEASLNFGPRLLRSLQYDTGRPPGEPVFNVDEAQTQATPGLHFITRSYDEDEETMAAHFNLQPSGLPSLLCFFAGHDRGEDGVCRRAYCSSGKAPIPRLELGDNSLAHAINPGPTFTYAVEIGSIAETGAYFVTFAGSRYSVATTAQAARDCLFPGDACAAGDCVEVAKLGPLYIGRLAEMT